MYDVSLSESLVWKEVMRIFSDLRAYFFNAIINVIIFLYEKGAWGSCGDR